MQELEPALRLEAAMATAWAERSSTRGRDWGPDEEPLQVGFRICEGVVVDSWMEPYHPEEEER